MGKFSNDATATVTIGARQTTLPLMTEGVPVPDEAINGVPRPTMTLTAGKDAAISFVNEAAAFESSLGVYLVKPTAKIAEPRWVYDPIEHALADPSGRPAGRRPVDARPHGAVE